MPIHAQQPTEKQMLDAANQALTAKDYPRAIQGYQYVLEHFPKSASRETAQFGVAVSCAAAGLRKEAAAGFEVFRKEFPNSALFQDATVRLFAVDLRLGGEHGEALLGEITTRWPKSEAAWQAIAIWFTFTVTKNPDWTLDHLSGMLQTYADALPPDAPQRALLLRLGYLEKGRPAQYLTEAVGAVLAAKTAAAPEEFAGMVGLAGRLYASLIDAGKVDDARTVHATIQTVSAKFPNANWAAPDTAAYQDALDRGMSLVATARDAPDSRQAAPALDLAVKLYTPLRAEGRAAQADSMHSFVQTVCTRLKIADRATTDTAAYLDAKVAALTADQRQALAKTLTASAAALTDPATAGETLDQARRLYSLLMTDTHLNDAGALHAKITEAMTRLGLPEPQVTADAQVYLRALHDYLSSQLATPTTTLETRTSLQHACRDAWQQHAVLAVDQVIPLVRDRLQRDVAAADWLAPYAALVTQLPADHPSRRSAALLLGQFAQHLASLQAQTGGKPDGYLAQAETAYRAVLQNVPGDDLAVAARAQLIALYQTTNHPEAIETIVQQLVDGPQLIDALQWLAMYRYQQGGRAGLAAAQGYFTRLLALAPQHLQAARWQLALGQCAEKLGQSQQAAATYRKVIELYPDSSCALAAMWQLEHPQ